MIISVAVFTSAVALLGVVKKRSRRRVLGALISSAVLTGGAWVVIEKLWKPFPDPNPWTIYLSACLAVFSSVEHLVPHWSDKNIDGRTHCNCAD